MIYKSDDIRHATDCVQGVSAVLIMLEGLEISTNQVRCS